MRYVDFLSTPFPVAFPSHRPFVKMHGLKNHFVIMDRRREQWPLDTTLITRICDRYTGIGAEQLLTIETPADSARAAGAYAAMRIFNVDGREVGACGNATRCVAHLLLQETGSSEVCMETAGGLLRCTKAGPLDVSITLAPVRTAWEAIPTAHAMDTQHLPIASGPLKDGAAVQIGNPHAVFFVDRLDTDALVRYAPAIQNHPLFPEGINVGAAQVVDAGTLRLAVWERPGILTMACGTGACVAAWVAFERGLVTRRDVSVHLPGGVLQIRLNEDGTIVMTGPVAFCCHGFVDVGPASADAP